MKGVQGAVKPIRPRPQNDGNIYALIGWISAILHNEGQHDEAEEFIHRTLALSTYDEILGLSQDYVEFENGEQSEPESN